MVSNGIGREQLQLTLDPVVWYRPYNADMKVKEPTPMTTLTIGKVARRADVGIETVRFYEREGLIDAPPRGPSGYRHYPESVIQRLLFIRRAKELGFTLNEIKELLSLRLDPETTCADVKQRAETKIADIEDKLRSLRRMRKALIKLTESCLGSGPAEECPILEALDPRERKR